MTVSCSELLGRVRVLVCAGAGGVGKTTTAAALATSAARSGRRVLVLTIDPSRRLAQLLGIRPGVAEPVSLPPEALGRLGISPPGELWAWALEPQVVADGVVKRVLGNPAEVARFLQNPIYRRLSVMAAGMQEYAAMEALHGFLDQGRWDLIVVDTPPSRHALDFIEAPERLVKFLDTRVLGAFAPKRHVIMRAASRVALGTLALVAGEQFVRELSGFLEEFDRILHALKRDVASMRVTLGQPSTAFVLVSTPSSAALSETRFFLGRMKALALPLGGLILNQTRAPLLNWPAPTADQLAGLSAEARELLLGAAEIEAGEAVRESELLTALRSEMDRRPVWSVPPVRPLRDDLDAVARVAGWLT